jgi:Poly(hydroxyalcanoate) granule associated protein (phasin)
MPKADTPDKESSKEPRHLAARSIWLAGLGALAVAEEKHVKLLFYRLVERGRNIEVLGRVNSIKTTANSWEEAVPAFEEELATLLEEVSTAPSAAEVAHLRRNADARAAFLAEFGTLTSREVADLAGSRAANRAALANRWKAEGRIFAVESGGQTLFPAFQFSDDGRPRPVIAEILAVLHPKLSAWQTALWFTGRNGWLGAKRPVDVLISDPKAAAEAARQEAEAFD